MKFGIIADIHNNITALESMLRVFSDRSCDSVICAGDILSIGPFPSQTVSLIMSLDNVMAVRGNHDRYLTEAIPACDNLGIDELNHHQWEKSLLSEAQIKYISSLPYRIDTIADGVKLTVLHYAMNERNEYLPIVRDMSENDCIRMFNNIDSDVIIFGHSHRQAIFHSNSKLFINVGSLGCPSQSLNVAVGGILTVENAKASIETVKVNYDADCVLAEINRLNYPCADYIKKEFYGVK